ncbi:MAG: hypothetical protein WCP32_17510, partial [Bacteroidota bacterium]
ETWMLHCSTASWQRIRHSADYCHAISDRAAIQGGSTIVHLKAPCFFCIRKRIRKRCDNGLK